MNSTYEEINTYMHCQNEIFLFGEKMSKKYLPCPLQICFPCKKKILKAYLDGNGEKKKKISTSLKINRKVCKVPIETFWNIKARGFQKDDFNQ